MHRPGITLGDDIHVYPEQGHEAMYIFQLAKYLHGYVDETVFRHNTRKLSEGDVFSAMMGNAMRQLAYQDVKM